MQRPNSGGESLNGYFNARSPVKIERQQSSLPAAAVMPTALDHLSPQALFVFPLKLSSAST